VTGPGNIIAAEIAVWANDIVFAAVGILVGLATNVVIWANIIIIVMKLVNRFVLARPVGKYGEGRR
jgi:hypothetical protein